MPIHADDGDPNESPLRREVEAGWCTACVTLTNMCGTTAGDRGLCLLAAWGGVYRPCVWVCSATNRQMGLRLLEIQSPAREFRMN